MDVWNEEAATFAEHWGGLADPARHAIADALELQAGVRLLDIGCGGGDFCALALARGAQVSGIDAAPAMVEIARGHAAGADLRVGAMERLPWDDGTFDAVTGFNSLQFADDPVSALREWVRVVRPGGKVAICAWGPRENNDLEVLEAALRGLADSPAPGRSFGREGNLEAVRSRAGLELLAGATVARSLRGPRPGAARTGDALRCRAPTASTRPPRARRSSPPRHRSGAATAPIASRTRSAT